MRTLLRFLVWIAIGAAAVIGALWALWYWFVERGGALLFVVVLLAGCATGTEMHVRLGADDPEVLDAAHLALAEWGRLGFIDDARGELWQIEVVTDLRTPDQYANPLAGRTDVEHGIIQVNASLSGPELQHTLTHELGHAIAGLPHLTCDKYGVMLDGLCTHSDRELLVLSPDDLALACDEAGLCSVER